jgi:hypothetical protein
MTFSSKIRDLSASLRHSLALQKAKHFLPLTARMAVASGYTGAGVEIGLF